MSCISTCSQCIIRHDRMFIDHDLLRMQCDLKMEKNAQFFAKMAKIDAELKMTKYIPQWPVL
jgi:hypothetical protein